MRNFRRENNLTLDEKEGSAQENGTKSTPLPPVYHKQEKNMEKRSPAVHRTEIEKIVEMESAIVQVIKGRGMKSRPLNENTKENTHISKIKSNI